MSLSATTGPASPGATTISTWTLVFLFCLGNPLSAQAQTSNRTAAPIDSTNRVVLHGHRPAWARPENDQGRVPDGSRLGHLVLVLKRSPQQQKAFEQFLQQQQNPASPNYHRWLTPIEVGERFGSAQNDIDGITAWLRGQGLRVDSVANSRMMIDFSGSALQVGTAFATEMHYYSVGGEQRLATADEPQIPAALSGKIQSILGLYTIKNRPYSHAEPARFSPAGGGWASPAASFDCQNGNCTHYIFPADFSAIYDLNPVYKQGIDGTGQTIAIIGRARVYEPDIENFETLSSLTVKDPVVIIPPSGKDPGPADGTVNPAPGDQGEATLDVTRVTSIAPGATIDLIVSSDAGGTDGIGVAAEYAVDTNPIPAQIMSISFGECETTGGKSAVQFWDALFSAAAAEGISVFVSSGDSGAAGCDASFKTPPASQVASPNYICSSSYATCVGGTEFADTADPSQYWNQNPANAPPYESALGYIPEGGWNAPSNTSNGIITYRVAGSGGGVSAYIATPSWQTGTGVPGTAGRYTPDIAFSASGHDGYFACMAASGSSCVTNGQGEFSFTSFSGTSAAAPDMAGITALLNQKEQSAQGELNQRLYQLAAGSGNVFHDVTVSTSGVTGCAVTTPSMCNNSTPSPTALTGGLAGYLVTAGYDEVTGLGSIDVANLLANFVPNPTTATSTALTSSASTIWAGSSVTFTATITPSAGATSSPTGTVTFYNGSQVAANILGAATLNSAGAASLTTTRATVGSDSISAVYAGDANYHGSASQPFSETVNAVTFAISATPAAQTISGSGAATITVTVTPQGPYTSPITFSAVMSPTSTAQVSFSPAQVTPNSGPATTTLTIQSATVTKSQRADNSDASLSKLGTGFLCLPFSFAGLLFVGGRNQPGRRIMNGKLARPMLQALFFASIALTMFGCGGASQSSSSKTQTYQVTISAVGAANGNIGAMTVTTTVALTIQQ
jgi:subtilase family serine protease